MSPYFHGSKPVRKQAPRILYPGQKPGVHDHKPQDLCPDDCPARRVESTRDDAPNFNPPYLPASPAGDRALSDLSRPSVEGGWPSFNETAPLPQRNTVVKHHQRCLPDRAACNCADNKALQDAVDVVTDPGAAEVNPHRHRPDEFGIASAKAKRDAVITDPDTGGRKGSKLARFDMVPPDVLWELAEHYGKGEAIYPSDPDPNWQRGYSWRLSVAALHRHLSQWEQGEDVDAETGSSHLIAATWHCVALRYFQLHGKGTDYREVKP